MDPYAVLGVERSATEADIKTAFRRLAAEHHPDKNPGDPGAAERFNRVNQAYQVLSDKGRRRSYDRFGSMFSDAGHPDLVDLDSLQFDGVVGSVLERLGVRTNSQGNRDVKVELTFAEAALGTKKTIAYERAAGCDPCGGTGARPGTTSERCRACDGSGRTRTRGFLPLAVEHRCLRCGGLGSVPRDPCGKCGGRGLATSSTELNVELPSGLETGSIHVVRGAGDQLRHDRTPGDLRLCITVAKDDFFRRDGRDVHCQVPISVSQAALGASVRVPTLHGAVMMTVPPGTQPGALLRLKGKGVPGSRAANGGDQLVTIDVEIPTQLTDEARDLFERLARIPEHTSQPRRTRFLSRLRELFD